MNKHFFLTLVFISQGLLAQETLSWDDLADVHFEFVYNEIYEVYFQKPIFGEQISAYNGKKIKITGFYLDIAGDGELVLLSQNPMSSCFFCGPAGPETVIEVNFVEKPTFKTDQTLTITGQLELNVNDVDHFNYILNQATGEVN